MNIQEARKEIIRTIRAYTAQKEDGTYVIPSLRQRPLLLIGPPGIGKTAIMEQAARECQVGFVSYTMTHHTRQSALGLPYIERRSFGGEEYAVTEYTMSEIIASVYRCMEETGVSAGLLFLDEINCVSETLAPAMLQFLQNKTFGSHRLPDGWVLAAAGNPPEYNKSVHEFDIATLDRLKYIPVEADYDAWRAYALGEAVHGAILAYLDTHPGQFYILKQTYASRTFATARGWEDLSCILKEYETLDFPVDAKLVCQYLQDQELAEDFSYFYQLYHTKEQHLPITQMLAGEEPAVAACRTLLCEGSFEEQIYLVHLMLSCINEKLDNWRAASRQKTRFEDTADRLIRFQKQQIARQDSPAKRQGSVQIIGAFLEKEREILKIRREHGLSPDSELEEMRQALTALQRMEYRLRGAESNNPTTDLQKNRTTKDVETNSQMTDTGNYQQMKHAGNLQSRNTVEELLRQSCADEIRQLKNHCETITAEILDMLKYGIQAITSGNPGNSGNPDNPDNSGNLDNSGGSGNSDNHGNPDDQGNSGNPASSDNAALVLFLTSLRQNPVADMFFKQYPDNPCEPYWNRLDFSARENAIREMLTQ
ncbi:MAG: AAA family ATPase [Clostridiales bacterium]|nr:AAA family ATPase [Clostridiales bacterium]